MNGQLQVQLVEDIVRGPRVSGTTDIMYKDDLLNKTIKIISTNTMQRAYDMAYKSTFGKYRPAQRARRLPSAGASISCVDIRSFKNMSLP